ncbi:hypothetical protein GCM10028826_18710 [Mucilaginibacter boryungensis]
MNLNVFEKPLKILVKDERVNVWHLAMMFGIMQLASNDDLNSPIYISRRKVMEYSHINNFMTYHKCLKELQVFGHITYFPSYHPGIRSKIYIKNI